MLLFNYIYLNKNKNHKIMRKFYLIFLSLIVLSFSCSEDENPSRLVTVTLEQSSNSEIIAELITESLSDYSAFVEGNGSNDKTQTFSSTASSGQPIILAVLNNDGYTKVDVTFQITGRKDVNFERHLDKSEVMQFMIHDNGNRETARTIYEQLSQVENTFVYRVNF